jgi:hypothetical protein
VGTLPAFPQITIRANQRSLKMIRKEYPTQETIKRLLNYDKDTGIFTWKERPLSDFEDDMNPSMSHITWNSQYNGAVAGSTSGNYVRIQIGRTPFAAHKLAWIYVYGDDYKGDIDHKNRNKKDNRIDNLRPTTNSLNMFNSPKYNTNTSGVRGVYRGKIGRWRASIIIDGKYIYLGSFSCISDAAKARQEAEVKYGVNKYLQEAIQ